MPLFHGKFATKVENKNSRSIASLVLEFRHISLYLSLIFFDTSVFESGIFSHS